MTTSIRLEKFSPANYADLISWIDSEETLMQVAGTSLKFPLTTEQLDDSMSDQNRLAFSIVSTETNVSIGHCELYLSGDSARLGRIIIGDKQQRGKGLGQQIAESLLAYAFLELTATKADLNVFDWNINAIKCYEKVGFTINPNIIFERKIKDEVWTAINMVIDKTKWLALKADTFTT